MRTLSLVDVAIAALERGVPRRRRLFRHGRVAGPQGPEPSEAIVELATRTVAEFAGDGPDKMDALGFRKREDEA